jgi:hypothetical protein
MTTPIQLRAVLFSGKARKEESVTPASLLACCTKAMSTVAVVTVKFTPKLETPPTETKTFPVVAPAGTGTVMLVALQAVGVAAVPLKVTVLEPCEDPKFAPAMVTDVPTGPEAGVKLVMFGGGGPTVKGIPLLAAPPLRITMTGPVLAPAGTGATMLVEPQLVGVTGVPLNKTVPVSWLAPKLDPLIVTDVPTGPAEGLKFVMFGDGVTVKLTPLLAKPPTLTTTFPGVAPVGTLVTMLVSLQLVATTGIVLKVIELNPLVAPKLDPFIVNDVPTGPDEGLRLEMTGKTVNGTKLLLATPPTVTTTLPDTVPAGT